MNQNHRKLEKYSSAFTLSDMEIFIFPELFYSLVLANIMSPVIWSWRKDKWFDGIEKKSFNYKVNRVKQYIMDNTEFNLDLDTWGLTTKEQELARFSDFIDVDTLQQSNALFGYEGDKYYFSIDIRRHFGLDKYSDNMIPYWKTETIEAMESFRHKENYHTAAGECVSFSALYAAAMFIIAKIPLEKIFLIATPLHSQNFIDEKEGFFTNNRRIVTKKMWYNGTELSAKARRAVENEKITIVSHLSGYIHTLYNDATIDPGAFKTFCTHFRNFLHTDFSFEIFINYLKSQPQYWDCFQYKILRNGSPWYIDLTTIFNYERNSKSSFANESRSALFQEMDFRDFCISAFPNKIEINRFEDFISENNVSDVTVAENYFRSELLQRECSKMDHLFDEIRQFTHIEPKLPNIHKNYISQPRLEIDTDATREEIIDYLRSMREKNPVADYAFYAFRKMDEIDWEPFVMAALERNPVSLQGLQNNSLAEVLEVLNNMDNTSIYDDNRLALPDEVWNFRRGDGVEKAFVICNFLVNQLHKKGITLSIHNETVTIKIPNEKTIRLESTKKLYKNITLSIDKSIVCAVAS